MGEATLWFFAIIGVLTVTIPLGILIGACIGGYLDRHQCAKRTHALDYCDRCENDPKFKDKLEELRSG